MNYSLPHRRLNPLTGEYILVSPHRARRPWQGAVEKVPPENLPEYDPNCYLCPGNNRAGGKRNPEYASTFVFDNDFPALLPPEVRDQSVAQGNLSASLDAGLFVAEPDTGICRVVCFAPRHDLTLPELNQEEIEAVIHTWTEQTIDLGNRDYIRYVQVFENKGEMMGCSNPHPHSQIWSSFSIPTEPAKELRSQTDYLDQHLSCLLCDYLAAEKASGERLVLVNEHFTVLVPYWAIWPFETMLISHRHFASLPDLIPSEVSALADILQQITTRYDNMFEISFPYSMGFHQAPTDGEIYPGWHFHAHYYPPLLRSATVRKFMVGYEMLASPQRDLTPETAAARLRDLSGVHYRRQAE